MALQNVFGDLALDATLAGRYSGGKTPVTATVTAAGDTTIATPALGNAFTVWWVSAIAEPGATPPIIVVRLGALELYRSYAISHWEPFTGAADAALVINLSTAGVVAVTAHIEES